MYGRWEGELWFHRWHMWPVPSSSTPSVAVPPNSFLFIDANSFSKDGRKIHVGDCALFKPPHDSLPFVGRIRKLVLGKENNITLTVNWLYRPADVKLKEGASLEAAPNEVFYSFHKDEIPAASLLHPCKVTFLRKGIELPSGLSSFVCRRVYDIETKRLWWLTDKNYIKERQEEVDQLLDKTRIEMYGAVQTGGRSPKPLNGPNGTPQLKPSSDNVQNSSSSISSHSKSRKREHGVHNSDSVKRERLSKVDDADSGQRRPDHKIKAEISKITDKGGLVDFVGVEKLIQLMRPEKKLDLASRTMLVDVISVTERFDCLGRFVQMRGLSVLDEWLQEIHKGKIGGGSPKENDKSIEEFIFSLLRALDRLPVNLHALQTCNVGKSVNHLRSHKNSEIQKIARNLVGTWKRRVEDEMNIIETKSNTNRGGSWPSHMGSRRIGGGVGGPSEVSPKSATSPPSGLKSQQSKLNSTEVVSKSPVSPGPTKLATMATAGGGSSDLPSNKEGRSCSSSQSPNNSQSCSSDHGKTGGSSSVSKISSSVSHSKNSTNGKLLVIKNIASEKGSPTRQNTSERVCEALHVDNGNSQNQNQSQSQRLVVRLPNTGAESPVDSSTVSGKGSLAVPSEKPDQKVSVKVDEVKVATEVSQGKEESGVTPKPGKLYEASYSSINALVESCAKFSEVSVSPSVGDDVGMNLLASVAAGEMSRSDVSPESNSPLPQDAGQSEDNINVANGHVMGDSKDASPGSEVKAEKDDNRQLDMPAVNLLQNVDSVMAPDVKTEDASVDKNADDKPTKNNVNSEESASWSSSDMREDEKKSVHERTSNLATTSRGDVDLAPKSEEIHAEQLERQNSIERGNENIKKDEAVAMEESRSSEKANVAETSVKLDFDLNEVLPSDDNQLEVEKPSVPESSPALQTPLIGNRSGSITVAAAAKGPFYPSENLLRGKVELGWKGSAATSAFRPAEPRKATDVPVSDNQQTSKQPRPFLDFDLNVGVVEDAGQNNVPAMRPNHALSGGGLDLDLNACEETPEVVHLSATRPPQPSLFESNTSRGFDLNGPGVEEGAGESVSFVKNARQFMSGGSLVRMSNNNNNNMEMGNFSSWFPPTNSYPAVTIPGRGDQNYPIVPAVVSQRMLTPVTATTSLNSEMFRGPVLSSSPAVAFPSNVPFRYSSFPFETNFSLPQNTYPPASTAYVDSTSSGGGPICFPAIPSQAQLVGPNGMVSMPYRPYFMSLPGGPSNVGPDGRKWGTSQGLDLNAGPAGGGGGGSQALADEQIKMFQQMAASSSSVASKRKEPDGGWDGGDRISYKHSWQ